MALDSKRTGTIHSKSGGDKTKLQAKFDGGALDVMSDNPDDFPQNAAVVYALQNITEDIDTLRTYAGTEIRTAVAANTAAILLNTRKQTNVVTNLTTTTHASQITLNSSDGDNVVVAEASDSIAGVMTVAHHDKLDGIEVSATADQSNTEILTAIEDGVDSVHYKDGSIDHIHLAADIIDGDNIVDNSVDTEHIADDAIEEEHIGAGEIKTAAIANDAVTTDKLADTINSAITANTAKTGISTSQASAITANTRKVGTETDLSVTDELTVLATVTENRGVYTLTFTMRTADGRTTKTADITMR